MHRKKNRRRFIVGLFTAIASSAHAASIVVPNFSFDTPDAHTPYTVTTKLDNWTTYGDFPFDTGYGAYSSGTGAFANKTPGGQLYFDNATGPSAGTAQVAYIFTKSGSGAPKVGLEQILTDTYAANTVYYLRIDVGLAGSVPGANDPFTFNLFYYDPGDPTARPTVAGRTIKNDGTNSLSGTHLYEFVTSSAPLLPTDPAVGKQIGIEIFTGLTSDPLATSGHQYDFDNVRVDTPEPAPLATIAVTAMVALTRRRRRASRN